jgi:hypothetical protein
MTVTAIPVTLWLLVVGGLAEPATLDRATELFYLADYQRALALIDQVLEEPHLPHKALVRARKFQAFCLFAMRLFEPAQEAWIKLLQIEPGYELDQVSASPEFISFFGRIALPSALSPALPVGVPAELAVRRPPPGPSGCVVLVCALPLGAGQFGNGQWQKGVAFAAAQLLALGTNVGLYWAQSPINRPGNAYLWVQRGSIGVFGGALVWGITDAFLSRPARDMSHPVTP